MYYDRIERTEVTALLDSIYQHVELLEDIQFLVKYATQILPPEPKQANGKVIWDNILALQSNLTQQREVFENLHTCSINNYDAYITNLLEYRLP